MLAHERRSKIAAIVKKDGSASVDRLADLLGVSTMTVWRDLRALEEGGGLRRVHGGIVRVGEDIPEPPFSGKQSIRAEEKEAIAAYTAAHLISDGDILIIEGGTTAAAVISHLEAENLTVLTNGLDVLNRAAEKAPSINVMSCGGMLRESSHTFVGPQAEAFFTDFRADKFILSATAFRVHDGLMDPNPLEIQIKRAMAKCARQRIAVVDSAKFALRSLAIVLTPSEIDILVTDPGVDREVVEQLTEAGIDVRIAGPQA